MRKLTILFVLAALVLTTLVLTTSSSYGADSKKTYSFDSSRKAGTIDRVELLLEVGGEVELRTDDKPERIKMSVVGKMTYDEKTLQMPSNSNNVQRSVRYYDKAEAVVKQGDMGMKPTLRDASRTIGVEINGSKITMFSPRGPLTRDELELIDIQCNSLFLDRLLPKAPVAIDQSWPLSDKTVCALFGLDVVAKNDVKCTLRSVKSDAARFELYGHVEGAFGGMATKLEVKAKYRFNLAQKRVDWIGLLVKEDRGCGHTVGGIDAVARLQLLVTPKSESEHLTETALNGLKPTDDLCRLVYKSSNGKWQFTHDRRWHVIADEHNVAIFRLVDKGELVTQCNVSPLPNRSKGQPISLEQFQEDIKLALDKNFGQFVQAGQRANKQDYRILHATISGTASDLPIQWDYYLVTDKQGHRVAFAFTTEAPLVKRLAHSDKQLVNSLRFANDKDADDTAALKSNERK